MPQKSNEDIATSDLGAIRARADAATRGPWKAGGDHIHPWEVVISEDLPFLELDDTKQGRANADFIAAARSDVPELLDRLAAIAELTHPCPPPAADEGMDSCEHGVWPCDGTRVAWLARGLDVRRKVGEAHAQWRQRMAAQYGD